MLYKNQRAFLIGWLIGRVNILNCQLFFINHHIFQLAEHIKESLFPCLYFCHNGLRISRGTTHYTDNHAIPHTFVSLHFIAYITLIYQREFLISLLLDATFIHNFMVLLHFHVKRTLLHHIIFNA